DGLIEAAEHPDRKFCIAVQWHPEMVGHDALFAALVTAAR
ncbi:MAG: gamma-glutamyl-gamma-aminobutyrate hydrolase family protein, partial [Candidatus Thermoplasmatota archaeon]|nr:gamma-glutamyl-gamma-aminobutyrate hydrolase family protein [Candidatus Thermoplasmatota archaeon]